MPTFDAVAWMEAREPWIYRGYRLGKPHEYVARPVSAEAMTDVQVRLAEAKPAELRRIVRQVLRLAFPWRYSMGWLGDPVKQIESLPLGVWEAVIKSFFECAVERPAPTPATDSPSTSLSETPPEGPASP